MADPQPRRPGVHIEDRWKRQDDTPKARDGIGKRWRVNVVGLDLEREFKSFARKVDAEAYEREVESQLLAGSFVTEKAGQITVAAVHAQWLTQQGHVAAATRAKRANAWATWVEPKWGTKTVGAVRKSAVRAWVAELVSAETGPTTIESAVEVLRLVLATAVEDRRLAVNPAAGVKLPARTHRLRGYLTHAQVWQLAATIDPRYRTLVLLLAYTGLRFGEAAALTVGDLTFLRRQIEVRQQVTEVEGKLSWTPTKGKRRRQVPFPRFLSEPLAAACEGKARGDQVFTAPAGGVLRLNSWRTRHWAKAVKALTEADESFPVITPHDLRHTAASLAVSAGANVLAVQRMLGHKSATLTLDTYADLFTDDLEAVAAAFDTAVAAILPPETAIENQSD